MPPESRPLVVVSLFAIVAFYNLFTSPSANRTLMIPLPQKIILYETLLYFFSLKIFFLIRKEMSNCLILVSLLEFKITRNYQVYITSSINSFLISPFSIHPYIQHSIIHDVRYVNHISTSRRQH